MSAFCNICGRHVGHSGVWVTIGFYAGSYQCAVVAVAAKELCLRVVPHSHKGWHWPSVPGHGVKPYGCSVRNIDAQVSLVSVSHRHRYRYRIGIGSGIGISSVSHRVFWWSAHLLCQIAIGFFKLCKRHLSERNFQLAKSSAWLLRSLQCLLQSSKIPIAIYSAVWWHDQLLCQIAIGFFKLCKRH